MQKSKIDLYGFIDDELPHGDKWGFFRE